MAVVFTHKVMLFGGVVCYTASTNQYTLGFTEIFLDPYIKIFLLFTIEPLQ